MAIDRRDVLLKAAYDILSKLDKMDYVESALYLTAYWDDAECDGFCLRDDIAEVLGLTKGEENG